MDDLAALVQEPNSAEIGKCTEERSLRHQQWEVGLDSAVSLEQIDQALNDHSEPYLQLVVEIIVVGVVVQAVIRGSGVGVGVGVEEGVDQSRVL